MSEEEHIFCDCFTHKPLTDEEAAKILPIKDLTTFPYPKVKAPFPQLKSFNPPECDTEEEDAAE